MIICFMFDNQSLFDHINLLLIARLPTNSYRSYQYGVPGKLFLKRDWKSYFIDKQFINSQGVIAMANSIEKKFQYFV